MMMGMAAVAGSRRRILQTSSPSTSGSFKSSTIKSGREDRAFFNASLPSAAVSTHSPFRKRSFENSPSRLIPDFSNNRRAETFRLPNDAMTRWSVIASKLLPKLRRRAARISLGGGLVDEGLHFAIGHFEDRILAGAGCADITGGPGLLAQVPCLAGLTPPQEDIYHPRQHSRRSPRVEVEIRRPAGLLVRVKAVLSKPKAGVVILTVPRQSRQAKFVNPLVERVRFDQPLQSRLQL